MMTQEQILDEIRKLSARDLRGIYARLSQAIREGDGDFDVDKFKRDLPKQDRVAIAKSLSGTFKPDSRYVPMTKEEDREVIMEYLEEKYG